MTTHNVTAAPRLPASPGSMAAQAPTRRSFLGGIAVVPIAAASALALPSAGVAGATPFRIAEARYWTATHRFENLPANLEVADPVAFERESQAYLASVTAVDTALVADWNEFADAIDIAADGGHSLPNEDLWFKLHADARRLAGEAA